MVITDCVLATKPGNNGKFDGVIFHVRSLTRDGDTLTEAIFVGSENDASTAELILITDGGEDFAIPLKLESRDQVKAMGQYLSGSQRVEVRYLDNDGVTAIPGSEFKIPVAVFSSQREMFLSAAAG